MHDIIFCEMSHCQYTTAQNGPDLFISEGSFLLYTISYLIHKRVFFPLENMNKFMLFGT